MRFASTTLAAVLFHVWIAGLPAQAQIVTTLLQFTNVWRYDISGAELSTVWRTNDFDDSAWASSPGLLGYDSPLTPYLAHVPPGIGTLFPAPLSQTVTTYYFRTTFLFNGSMQGLILMATNLVDDGCAIWLNGRLAGGVRKPTTFNATTVFTGPAVEGQLDVVSLTNFLREGVNQLAVEVHQVAASSVDVMFGMRLVAINHTPLVITNQLQSQMLIAGESVTLQVGVSGGPVSYRWQKDGVLLTSTSNSLVILSAQPAQAGNYRVICSNSLSVVTSSVAVLTVAADLLGPEVTAAIEDTSFGSNRINVKFSEVLNSQSARDTNNYLLTRLGSFDIVPLTNALYSSGPGALLFVDASDPDWLPGLEYVLTLNHLKDLRGNSIAPDTRIGVSRPFPTNIVSATATWSGHARYFLDQTIYTQPWHTVGFIEDPQFWITNIGPFCGGAVPGAPCSTDCETAIDYQLSPTLFRTTFTWPAEYGAAGRLVITGSVDDGMALFLNGVEIWRTNTLGSSANIAVTNYASVARAQAICVSGVSIPVTNFLTGTNCLAAAVLQPRFAGEFDTAFFLTADAIAFVTPVLVPDPAPALTITALNTNRSRLSWTGGGYLLEGATNLALGGLSYPNGPWTQVTNMSNPYTNPSGNAFRFFRLKR